jgi:hypothetical protein
MYCIIFKLGRDAHMNIIKSIPNNKSSKVSVVNQFFWTYLPSHQITYYAKLPLSFVFYDKPEITVHLTNALGRPGLMHARYPKVPRFCSTTTLDVAARLCLRKYKVAQHRKPGTPKPLPAVVTHMRTFAPPKNFCCPNQEAARCRLFPCRHPACPHGPRLPLGSRVLTLLAHTTMLSSCSSTRWWRIAQ